MINHDIFTEFTIIYILLCCPFLFVFIVIVIGYDCRGTDLNAAEKTFFFSFFSRKPIEIHMKKATNICIVLNYFFVCSVFDTFILGASHLQSYFI